MENNKRKLYIVAGPTASGKSKYAIDLAKKINGEIISLDSIQIYKGLDIGSGKIAKDEMDGINHYMIDEIGPKENINIKDFKDMAYKYIENIYANNHIPILVGGTGFYINAILYNTDFKEEDEEKKNKIREEIYNDIDNFGIDYVYEKLKEVDNLSYKNIHKNNIKRVVRALEYYMLNNTPISIDNLIEKEKESPYDFEFIVLMKDRDKLYKSIDERVDKMIENGLIEEMRNLIKLGVKKTDQSMQAIGYKELYDYVYNDLDDKNLLENIILDIKTHTHQYAKRQITWFKNQEGIKYVKI